MNPVCLFSKWRHLSTVHVIKKCYFRLPENYWCHYVVISYCRDVISGCHYVVMALYYLILSWCHYVVMSLYFVRLLISLCRYVAMPLPRCCYVVVSWYRDVVMWLCCYVVISSCRTFVSFSRNKPDTRNRDAFPAINFLCHANLPPCDHVLDLHKHVHIIYWSLGPGYARKDKRNAV